MGGAAYVRRASPAPPGSTAGATKSSFGKGTVEIGDTDDCYAGLVPGIHFFRQVNFGQEGQGPALIFGLTFRALCRQTLNYAALHQHFEGEVMALFFAFFGMLCWGLAPLFGKLGLRGTSPVIALSLRTMIAAGLIAIWTLSFGGVYQLRQVAPRNMFFITIEAMLATLVGDLAYFAALKYGNINQVTLILAASPLITIITAHFVLGERLTPPQMLGAFLITAGLFFVGFEAKY